MKTPSTAIVPRIRAGTDPPMTPSAYLGLWRTSTPPVPAPAQSFVPWSTTTAHTIVASPMSQAARSGVWAGAHPWGRIIRLVRFAPDWGVPDPGSLAEQRERADPADRNLMTESYGKLDPFL